MAEKKSPPSLENLESRLREARADQAPSPEPTSSHRQVAVAYRVLVEMIAGVGVGAAIGWWLDGWLGTRPIFLVIMILLGCAAGLVNVVRASRKAVGDWKDEQQRPGPSGPSSRE